MAGAIVPHETAVNLTSLYFPSAAEPQPKKENPVLGCHLQHRDAESAEIGVFRTLFFAPSATPRWCATMHHVSDLRYLRRGNISAACHAIHEYTPLDCSIISWLAVIMVKRYS